MDKILRIGHRGACGYAPENTLASMRKALELTVDMVEMDIHRCKSGEAVVIHDSRLERTTNGKGYVADKTLAELKSLDAGNGEKIPTLAEVLELVDKRAQLNLELKGVETAKLVASAIEECISKGWSYDQFLISSFDHYQVERFCRLLPGVRRGALFGGIPIGYAKSAEKIEAYSVHLSSEYVNKEFIKDAHNRGMKVFVYTVDEPEEIARIKSMGVDGIFSNFPDRI